MTARIAPATMVVAVLVACSREPTPTPAPLPASADTGEPRAPAAKPAPVIPAEEPVVEEAERPALDIEYVPTPDNVVDAMLAAAQVGRDDVVYDLGCGDGRLLVQAALRFGARGYGVDLDPERIAEAQANIAKAGVGHLVTIEQRNIFSVDLRPATVVTLYLLPALNVRLIPQLDQLRDGARIVSHDFDMEGVEYDDVETVISLHHRPPPEFREHYVYRFTAPLKKTPPEP